jgi:hypothetical protein
MRKRIWLACAVVAVLCVLLLLKTMQHPKTVLPGQSQAPDQQSPSQSEESQKAVQKRQEPVPARTTAVPPITTSPAATSGDSNAVAAQMLASWQAPIEFYGKVVDENSNAVTGAKVSFHWVEEPKPEGNRTSTTTSDANGLFSLQGARGPSLAVSVSKEGYYTSRQGLPEFRYGLFQDGNFSPDPQNPVVFHLKKKGPSEPLASLKRNYSIPRDGTPVSINIDTGATTPGENGNVVVRCWTQDQGKSSGQKYDWRCRVTIPGGGIVSTDEEFAFVAPETGYKPSTEITMPADRNDWTSDVDLRFFFRLADGRYGRMTFSMIAGGQHFCMIDSVLNPAGSRNLEPPN